MLQLKSSCTSHFSLTDRKIQLSVAIELLLFTAFQTPILFISYFGILLVIPAFLMTLSKDAFPVRTEM